MMRAIAIVIGCLISAAAHAQQNQCRTAPPGTSTSYCASEAFVTQSSVQGPSSSTAGDIPSFSDTSGKQLQDSGIPSAALPTAIGQLPGVATSTAAGSGNVGQVVTAAAATGGLTSGSPANVTSISLTHGDWDISFTAIGGTSAGTSLTDWTFAMSTTSASLTPIASSLALHERVPAEADHTASFAHGPTQVLISATTTYFLNVSSSFTGTAPTASGVLRARRMR